MEAGDALEERAAKRRLFHSISTHSQEHGDFSEELHPQMRAAAHPLQVLPGLCHAPHLAPKVATSSAARAYFAWFMSYLGIRGCVLFIFTI
jgi:hypothetical protein